MKVLVDDFVERGYFGVILTGGEPTLHPELPKVTAYARDQGLHVRLITNGGRLADREFARDLAEAGLRHVHISVYSTRPEVEAKLRGVPNTLDRAFAAVENASELAMDVNINSVINKLNADHLDETIDYWIEHHPQVRHFVWNNMDPNMGRAEVNQSQFLHRLSDCEYSLLRAMKKLESTKRTFRVERMPLCYMAEFAWASTETRKIIKGEERIVHFLDSKQTRRQTKWDHEHAEVCDVCSLRQICAGLYSQGEGYDSAELYPVFIDPSPIIRRVIADPSDPSYPLRTLAEWQHDFDQRLEKQRSEMRDEEPINVGVLTDKSVRVFERRRKADSQKSDSLGVELDQPTSAASPFADQVPVNVTQLEGTEPELTALQRVLDATPGYFNLITGRPATSDEAQKLFEPPPSSCKYDEKLVYGVFLGDEMIGCVDILRGYPDEHTAFLGLFLISEAWQSMGYGRYALDWMNATITEWGCTKVRLAVVDTNRPALAFWQHFGLDDTGERHRYEGGEVKAEIIVLEKTLPW